jgi:CRISPR-associated protein Csy1
MIAPAIENFFIERKDAWLKKKIKTNMDEQEKLAIERECEGVFSLENWLPNAASRAKQMTISTHPCTFSHPSARKNKNGYVSSVIAKQNYHNDGFFRTGNVSADTDVLGNAAVLDVYKFLMLVMPDDQTLLTHIEKETEFCHELFSIPTASFGELRDGFLEIVKADTKVITSSKIKQVYFPVEDDYHLLSVLTHSGHLFELRYRIDEIRFSEQTKATRELKRQNRFSNDGYREIYGITTIGYGGTKPQNISVLNNANGGKAHMLLSIPPQLTARDIRLPKSNFFSETFTYWQCSDIFNAFHRLIKTNYNNVNIREGRDFRIQQYIDTVIQKMWQLRLFFEDYTGELPVNIPTHQKIWLFAEHKEQRQNDVDWLDKVCLDISHSFVRGYEKIIGKDAAKMGDDLFMQVYAICKDNTEALL